MEEVPRRMFPILDDLLCQVDKSYPASPFEPSTPHPPSFPQITTVLFYEFNILDFMHMASHTIFVFWYLSYVTLLKTLRAHCHQEQDLFLAKD